MWKAAAYGDFEKLREISDAEPETLHRPDDQGFFALQWAALNNRVAVLTYLLDKGCDINAADSTGQTALHWAAVRGSTAALETLLRAGADLGAQDSRCDQATAAAAAAAVGTAPGRQAASIATLPHPRLRRGYTVCHVAAQYGQTAILYHLALKWSADTDSVDNDGRTPLHWGAYKGFAGGCAWVQGGGWHCAAGLWHGLAAAWQARPADLPPLPGPQTRCACCWCWDRASTCPTRRAAPRCTGRPSAATPRHAPCCCRCEAACCRTRRLPTRAAGPRLGGATDPSHVAAPRVCAGRRGGGADDGGQHGQHAQPAGD